LANPSDTGDFRDGHISYVACPLVEIQVYSQDVTFWGISFIHTEPLQSPYVVIKVNLTDTESISLLLEVRWTEM